MNKTKTLKMKLIYIVTAVAMLAMLIPAMALPVSAQEEYEVVLTNAAGDSDSGFDVMGGDVIATLYDSEGDEVEANWYLTPAGVAQFIGGSTGASVTVQGTTLYGAQVSIEARDVVAPYAVLATATKKFAPFEYTTFSSSYGSNSTILTWNLTSGTQYAEASITDTAYSTQFPNHSDPTQPVGVQGVVLNWYLFKSDAVLGLPVGAELAGPMITNLNTKQLTMAARYVRFAENDGTYLQTVTGVNGSSTVEFYSTQKEAVQIVVIPQYPNTLQLPVVPEITSWNFYQEEFVNVPQVRWIGEKIVLERRFSPDLEGERVDFVIGGNVSARFVPFTGGLGMNLLSNGQSCYTWIDQTGVASVALTSTAPEEVKIDSHLYNPIDDSFFVETNKTFRVIFLAFETINLSNVQGKRVGHDSGIWYQEEEGLSSYNPFNKYFPDPATGLQSAELMPPTPYDDVLEQIGVDNRNISEDALERVQVRGWFTTVYGPGSRRAEAVQDAELADQVFDVHPLMGPDMTPDEELEYEPGFTLPKYRWVFPDDWKTFSGGNKWWDIMDSPKDLVKTTGTDPLGPYTNGSTNPVVGPFALGLEVPVEGGGWVLDTITSRDSTRPYKTVVPNGVTDAWDAPMPPAKIRFDIVKNELDVSTSTSMGYFKWTDKGDVYIDGPGGKYTNPFYSTLVPAHWFIRNGTNSEGYYEWDSFGDHQVNGFTGPYKFWTIINRPSDVVTPTALAGSNPTSVEVYSDNHGEAMVWLNGDWNQNFLGKYMVGGKMGIDLSDGTVVGRTRVQAKAIYPFNRPLYDVKSNIVEKEWYWGGKVLGVNYKDTYAKGLPTLSTINVLSSGDFINTTANSQNEEDWLDTDLGTSNNHTAFIWACDRDGKQAGVLGTRVDWTIEKGRFALINSSPMWVSRFNSVTQNIWLDANGFLAGTNGVITNENRTSGYSFMRAPTDAEKELFRRNAVGAQEIQKLDPAFGFDSKGDSLKAENFAVAAIDLENGAEGTEIKVTVALSGPEFAYYGKQGGIGEVRYAINIPMFEDADRTMPWEYPLDDPIIAGDANNDGVVDAADITAVERVILEMDAPNVKCDANSNGFIDMGDVVKIMRIYRGLK